MSSYGKGPEDTKAYKKMVRMCVAAASFVMLIFLATLYYNTKPKTEKDVPVMNKNELETETVSEDELVYGQSDLTSDDLDFWDMYGDTGEAEDVEDEEEDADKIPVRESVSSSTAKKTVSGDTSSKETKKEDTGLSEKEKEENRLKASDGKHTSIINDEGKVEWIELDETLSRNSYAFDTNLIREGEMIKYYDGNKLGSSFGIDVSKHSGEIDWAKVKAAGVQFAMIRVGARGYGTGQMIADEYFTKNIEGAIANGIKVGVYFFSQATSTTEAVEEANFTVAALAPYKITYPVVCDIEEIKNDNARTDALTQTEITQYTKDFCDTVKSYGYQPMIYADKECLLTRLDLTKLSAYDVWLAQAQEKPDYPYMFAMWQYSQVGVIDGVPGEADLNVSFVNYEEK
ncbi:MAG TPA: glycoside hydrolase family 25 protein [Lachnospiraceae bacterium]|nr:glycoside hydrolase family 25 protein [Lachnospiraceae bacterium]